MSPGVPVSVFVGYKLRRAVAGALGCVKTQLYKRMPTVFLRDCTNSAPPYVCSPGPHSHPHSVLSGFPTEGVKWHHIVLGFP